MRLARVSPEARSVAGIALCAAVFFYRLWCGPGIVYSEHSDTIVEHASHRVLLQKAVAEEGHLPLWNPSMNGGYPAFANPLAPYVFPFELLYLVLPLDRATNLIYLLNFALAGIAMFVYARSRLERAGSALICGIGYMLAYRYLALLDAGWLPRMSLYALAPLVFWSVDRLILSRRPREVFVLAGLVMLGLIQSDLQQFYYLALALVPYVAVGLWHIERSQRAPALVSLVAAVGFGVLLSAPVLLPRLEFIGLSTRNEPSYAFFRYKPPTLAWLVMLLDPLDDGGRRVEYWENVLYCGLWLYPLCLYALIKAPRSRWKLAVAGLVPILLSFDTWVLRALYDFLPGFSIFRIPGRMMFLSQLFWTILAGLGVDSLLRAMPRRTHAGLIGLLVALPIADATARMLPRIRTVPLSEAFPDPPFHEKLRRDVTDGRVAEIGRGALAYGMAGAFRIDLVNGYSSLNLKHFMDYFLLMKHGRRKDIPLGPKVFADLSQLARPDMLAALDARFIVTTEPLQLQTLGYEPDGSYEDVPVQQQYRGLVRVPVHVWRLREPLGPAYFATSVHSVADDATSLAALERTNSVKQAFVMGYDGKPGFYENRGKAGLTRRGIDEYEYSVETDGDGFLIMSQIWYPGWRATLDGNPIPLYRTNHALLGCAVPAGRHRLVLTMTCPRAWRGAALATVALLAFSGWAVWTARRRRSSVPARV